MKNINEYKKRFFNLLESQMGDVKPLISEQAATTKKNVATKSTATQTQNVSEGLNNTIGKELLDALKASPQASYYGVASSDNCVYSFDNKEGIVGGKSSDDYTFFYQLGVTDKEFFDETKPFLFYNVTVYIFKILNNFVSVSSAQGKIGFSQSTNKVVAGYVGGKPKWTGLASDIYKWFKDSSIQPASIPVLLNYIRPDILLQFQTNWGRNKTDLYVVQLNSLITKRGISAQPQQTQQTQQPQKTGG